MNRINPNHALAAVEAETCPLCDKPKSCTRRCCEECLASMEAVELTEDVAISRAGVIRNWRVQ